MSKNLKLKRMVQFLNKNNLKISEMLKHFQTFSIEVPAEKNVCLLNSEFKLFEVIIKKEEYVIAYNNIVNFIKRQVKNLVKEAAETKKMKKTASSLLKLWNKTKSFVEEDSTSIDLADFSSWLLKTVIDFSASTRSLPHSFSEFNITDNLDFVDDHFNKEVSLDVILKLKCVVQPKSRNCDIICTVAKYVLKEHTKPTKNFFKFLKVVLLVKILTNLSKAGVQKATSLLEEFMKKMMIPPNFWSWAEQNITLKSIPKGKTFKSEKQLKWILQNMNTSLVYDVLFDNQENGFDSKNTRSNNSVTANSSTPEPNDCNKSPSGSGKKNKSNNLLRSKDLNNSFSESGKISSEEKKTVDGNLETVGEWSVKKINEEKEKRTKSPKSKHENHEYIIKPVTSVVLNNSDSQVKVGFKKVRRGKKKVCNKTEAPATSVVLNITDSQVKEGFKKVRRGMKKVSNKTESPVISVESNNTDSEVKERFKKKARRGKKKIVSNKTESPLISVESNVTDSEVKEGFKKVRRGKKKIVNNKTESPEGFVSILRKENKQTEDVLISKDVKNKKSNKVKQTVEKNSLSTNSEFSERNDHESSGEKRVKKRKHRKEASLGNENEVKKIKHEPVKNCDNSWIIKNNDSKLNTIKEIKEVDPEKKKIRKRKLKAMLNKIQESSDVTEIELVKIKNPKKKAKLSSKTELTNISMMKEDTENEFESVMPNSLEKSCPTISDTAILKKSVKKNKKASKEIVSHDTIKEIKEVDPEKKKIRKRKLKAIEKEIRLMSSDKAEQANISMIEDNEFESVMPNSVKKNCSTISDTGIKRKSVTKTKKVSKERTYSDVDEASGNDSDIIDCDEDNAMFTKEETCNYHQFQLKETKDNIGKIKAMLSNVMPTEDKKSMLDEEPSVKNRKLSGKEDDIALNMFCKKSQSNDLDSEVRNTTTTSKDFEHDDDLPYGNDSETDLEIVFATIQKDTDNENSIVVKKENLDNEDCYQEPIIKSSTAPTKRCGSSVLFVESVFNIYGNKDQGSGVEVLYDNTKNMKSSQMPMTEATSSHISSLKSSKRIKGDRKKPALKKNLDENSELEFIGSITMGSKEERCHLRSNKDQEEECLLDSVEDCHVNNNDKKEENSLDIEEAPDQEILIIDEYYNDSAIEKKDSVESDNNIEGKCQIDKEGINKEKFLKVTNEKEIEINLKNNESENENLNESLTTTMNSECDSDIHHNKTRASVCEASKIDDDILIDSISSKDLDASTMLDSSKENQTVNGSQSNCIGELYIVPEDSQFNNEIEIACSTKSNGDECETNLESTYKSVETSGSVDNCIVEEKEVCSEKLTKVLSLEGEPSLTTENLSEENLSDDDFTLRIEESFNDDSKKKESPSEFSHIKVLSFDEVREGKNVEIIESNKEISVVTPLVSNGLITETVSQSPGNDIENKENIMDNKQEEDKNASLISEFSEENKFSLSVKESEKETNSLLKSLKQEMTRRSPSKIGSKRTSIEKSVCNMTALTPLKVSNAALANEIVISPQVSDEENASQIMNGEIENENILPFISDDILSKSYVEEEQEDEDMERNVLSPPSSSNKPKIEKATRRTSRLGKSLNLSDLSCSKVSPLKLSKVSNLMPLSSTKQTPSRIKSALTPSPMKSLSSSKKHSILHSSKKQSPSVSSYQSSALSPRNQSLTISSEKITSPLSSRAESPLSSRDKSPIPSKFSSPILSRKLTSPFSSKKSPSLSTSSPSSVKKSPVFTKPSPKTIYQVAVKAKNSPNVANSPPSLVRRSPRHSENISKDSSTNEESKSEDMPLKKSETSRSCSPADQSEARDIVLSPLKARYSLRRLRNPVTPEKQVISSPLRRRSSLSSVKKENIETQSLSSPVRPRARRNSLSSCTTPVRRSRRISGLPEDIAE